MSGFVGTDVPTNPDTNRFGLLVLIPVDVFWRELGRDCTHLRRPDAVALEWESDARGLSLRTDPRKLTIIVRNLVGNALKFTEKGYVRVEAATERGALYIQVRDTGIGIKADDQDAIFEKFRQADSTSSGASPSSSAARSSCRASPAKGPRSRCASR